ncbi:DUF1845 domain-containing protein [Pseudoduganella namucuonensis]|uniref:DUF1845 domain-containing protein n=1 Tax=Pseudoduganella namucuonensis TaxID=1035707 RepID=A0A1I7HKR5_9BURK|nr:DUF1845 domain-containing protein [Pseudoduganella namucuonensis]SFU61360.1 hypothetical protein SAMN05216552_100616 [Pseudoduganella namucuonensis]
MNAQTDTPILVSTGHGATNRKLLARQSAAKTDRIESASRKVGITLCSPEGKRLYLRCFEISQINFHYITVFARMKVADTEVERIERELRTMLDSRLTRLNQALADAEAKCTANGISQLATYDVEPLAFEAKVFSMLDRRLLELIEKVDQLMPMLETLCIDEVITPSQLIIEKSKFKKTVRGAAKAARIVRGALEHRANLHAPVPATPEASTSTAPATSINEGAIAHPHGDGTRGDSGLA